MNPIVNPIWFYLASAGGKLACALGWIGGIGLCIGVIGIIIGACLIFDDEEEYGKKVGKTMKPLIIASIFCIIGCCAIPSETACYQMAAASIVTENNIKAVGDVTTDIVDYIVDSVNQIMSEEKED